MEKIGLLIDSTTATDDILISYDFVKIVYLNVIIDHREYLEKELSKTQMEKYIESNQRMTTSQPAPADFIDVFEEFKNEGYTHIIAVVLSDKMSGTFQSGVLAKSLMNIDIDVTIKTPRLAGFGITNGLRILSKEIEANKNYKHVMKRYNEIFKDSLIAFTVTDLNHLYNGGRLTRIQSLIGTVLRIKPIIQVVEGKFELVKKARTNNACQNFFLNEIDKYVKKYNNVYLDIVYLNAEKWGQNLKKTVTDRYENIHIHITNHVSPVLYVHLGNKGYGISIIAY